MQGQLGYLERVGVVFDLHEQLRADLGEVRPPLHQAETTRQQGEAQRTRERAQVATQRRSDVRGQLQGYRTDHAGAQAAWHEMSETLQARRMGGVAVAETPTPVAVEEAPSLPMIAPEPPTAPGSEGAAEEEAVAQAEVGDLTPEIADLSQRVFGYLADHPDGVRLTEIEGEFGLGRFQAARVVRHLIDEGNTDKRDLLYFAI